jgi:uridine phosphorylase
MTTAHTPLHPDGVQMHLKIRPGDVPRYVLTPGDPGRVPVIGAAWDSFEEVAHFREYRTIRGRIDGVDIAACSHGIGGPSTDIAIVELSNCGADTFIRVGSCAALQPDIAPGDLVIATGALRLTGTVDAYIGKEYPAVADHEVLMALIEAAEELGEIYHVGLAASVDSFYAGEVNPMPGGYWQSSMDTVLDDLRRARVANFEMEAATIFTLCQLFGFRGGMICSVGANRITRQRADSAESIQRCCRVASRAVAILAGWDARKAAAGKRHLHPALLR